MSQTPLIVAIEDEEDLLELLEFRLSKEGYDVVGYTSTDKVIDIINEEDVKLLIVDRNLAGQEGSDFIGDLRERGYQVPVIFLTAKASQEDIIDGLSKGADDYITKPFNIDELILRIKAVIKRTSQNGDSIMQFRDIIMNLDRKSVVIDGTSIDLTKLEFELLVELIRNKGVVLSRDYLLENVWREGDNFQEKTVNVAVKRLKEKVDPEKSKNYIKTVRGYGYSIC